MLKDLLFPVTGAASDDAALRVAIDIASAHGARLIVAVPSPSLTPLQTPWGITPDAVLGELLRQVEREAEQLADAFRERLRNVDVPWEVRIDEARFLEPTDALMRQARYADVSVLARPTGDDGAIAHAYFRSFLFGSGRPVLVVPAAPGARRFKKMLLAWKPTRESTRAAHDAIAVFAPESVEILTVDPEVGPLEHGDEPGADIAAHLARHGVQVSVSKRRAGSMSVATTVLLHAAEHDADLVVAGGYGHARLREWVLGGATRELLEALEIPVLFSH